MNASSLLATVLAERAFHALRCLEGSPLPVGKVIQREQTSFQVELAVQRGPCSDQASQGLGRQMRQIDVEAFEVASARAPLEAACVGVLSPAAFQTLLRVNEQFPPDAIPLPARRSSPNNPHGLQSLDSWTD